LKWKQTVFMMQSWLEQQREIQERDVYWSSRDGQRKFGEWEAAKDRAADPLEEPEEEFESDMEQDMRGRKGGGPLQAIAASEPKPVEPRRGETLWLF
jgi:hypothetical protein